MIKSILSEVTPVPASYLRAARRIERLEDKGLIPIRVAIAATFTADLLPPYLIVEGAAAGLKIAPYIAPFNQLEQSLMTPDSALYSHSPDAIVIAADIRELAPTLFREFPALSSKDVEELGIRALTRIRNLVTRARELCPTPILVFNFAEPERMQAGLADTLAEPSQIRTLQRENDQLAALCREHSDVYVFDYRGTASRFGLARWYDSKQWHWNRIPFSSEAHIALAKALVRHVRATRIPPCKCLVVDLDNTLWGGVVGEDGLDGIALGEDYPGSVYKDFQFALKALKERGILLAIASKNNPQDAEMVFREHPDCVLSLADFAAVQIHWNDKAESVRTIARDLKIDADAIAFFDDNPVERDWLRSALPDVKVIEVPNDPLQYLVALDDSACFDQLVISPEDRGRSQMYQAETKRKVLHTNSVDLDEFLRDLHMKARIGFVDKNTLHRVAQLAGKTNQFNLTARRHSAADIERMLREGAVGLWMRLSDKFGDNGLVAASIACPKSDEEWHIDTFLMSCRVLGRKSETALLSAMLDQISRRGARRVVGHYRPTAKNGLAAGFYREHQFRKRDGEGCEWVRDAKSIKVPAHIAVEFDAET